MKPIVPIKRREQSANVANLHEVMKFFGIGDLDREDFRKEVAEQIGAEWTEEYIRGFQNQNGINYDETLLVDQTTADFVNKLLEQKRAFDQETPKEESWIVRGKITLPNGKPGAKLTIQLYEQDFRSVSSHDSTNTDSEGKYEIKYLPSKYTDELERYSPDLFIQVTGGGAVFWDESPIYYNVSPVATIDLKIQKEPIFLTPEFDRLEKEVRPIIKALPPQDLKASDNDKQDDFGYLANETGWERKLLEFWSAAYQYKLEAIKQDPFKTQALKLEQAFYAWQRVPDRKASYESILSQPTDTLLAQLKTAGEKKYIQPFDDSIERDWVDALSTERERIAFHTPYNGLPSFATLLAIVTKHSDFQKTFFGTLEANNGILDNLFWKNAAEALPQQEKLIQKTKLLLDVTPLVDSQTSVGDYLVNKANYKELSNLVSWTVEQWESLLGMVKDQPNALQIPDFIQGANPEERIKKYAQVINDRMRQTFPSAYFQKDLLSHENAPFKSQWQKFLKINPQFQFGTPALGLMLRTDKSPFKFEGIEQKQEFAQELVFTNRIFAIAPNYGHVATLRKKGFTSAFDMAQYDYNIFKDLISKEIPEQQGLQYHVAAVRKTNVVTNTFARVLTDNGIITTVFGQEKSNGFKIVPFSGPGVSEADNEVNQAVGATLANLFGSLEQAECEECMSVLSPAAYFVDTLNRLRVDAKSTFEELMRRRPDLGLIDLTCANTNTSLPYIDLVIEILERFIAQKDSLQNQNNEVPQTTLPSETLAVMPETPAIESVYAKLRSAEALYPFSLPFNLHWEQIRVYLNHLGIRREEIMALVGEKPDRIAAEYFGISPQEAVIITTKPEDGVLHQFYGFSNSTVEAKELMGVEPAPSFEGEWPWTKALTGFVNVFLYKTEISYRDLLTLLSTRFVQGKNTPDSEKPRIVSRVKDATTSKLDELQITQLTTSHLQRIYRFIRLWRRLGWSMYDLDRALMALSQADIDSETLVELHQANKIRQRLNLTVEEVSVLFDGFDEDIKYRDFFTEGQPLIPSLFQRTYKNRVFGPQSSQTVAVMAKDPAYIAAVCQLSTEEVDQLQSAFKWQEGLQKLSQAYGIGLLVRAAGISVGDFLTLKALVSFDSLQLNTAEKLLDTLHLVQQSKLSIEDIKFILTAKSVEDVTPLFKLLKKEIQMQRQAIEGLSARSEETIETLTKRLAIPQISTLMRADESLVAELPYFDYGKLATQFLLLKDESSMREAEIRKTLEDGISKTQRAILLLQSAAGNSQLAKIAVQKFQLFDSLPTATISNDELASLWASFETWIKFVAIHSTYNQESSEWKSFNDRLAPILKKEVQPFTNEEYKTLRKTTIYNRLGISPDIAAEGFLQELAKLSNLKNTTEKVRSYAKAKYTKAKWLKIAKPLQDALREKQRDVLTDYILTNYVSLGFTNRNELYEYLLIDVEMSACMKTSRLKLAISSVQLFIERVLMGLERVDFKIDGLLLTIPPTTPLATQWNKWRKWYRIWEANRKVFLYPENWIEPELRDNKSPFFEELENQLAQNAVTAENAERAFRDYFAKFETVARLEIIAQYHEKENPAGEGTLHVFGRTYSDPRQFFYRRCVYGEWTAWERVDLDIEGDAMTPVVWNGKLYLFWLNFLKKSEESSGSMAVKNSEDGQNQTISSDKPVIYYDIRFVWSEYDRGKWKAKKLSNNTIDSRLLISETLMDSSKSNEKNYILLSFFRSIKAFKLYYEFPANAPDTLNLLVASHSANSQGALSIGSVRFNDRASDSVIIEQDVNRSKPYSAFHDFGNFDTTPLIHENVYRSPIAGEIQFSNPQTYSLCYDSNFIQNIYEMNFFFQDEMNNFILRSKPWRSLLDKITHNASIFYHPLKDDLRRQARDLSSFFTVKTQSENFTNAILNNYSIRSFEIDSGIGSDIGSVDFSFTGSYSLYNWELFFHIPITIACRLSENQQFAEARDWFHYIFDPTKGETGGKDRFWRFRPFHEKAQKDFVSLEELVRDSEMQIEKWEANAFQPHVIARMRVLAYMKFTVMRYIDNLINWGDQLFQRDTIESINEATLLYVLASKILGKRPEVVPRRAVPVTQRFSNDSAEQWVPFLTADLEDAVVPDPSGRGWITSRTVPGIGDNLDAFSNATVPIREFIVPNASPSANELGLIDYYFCIPKNAKLLGYWDIVADRLFKIRNCMNIQGVVRQLPLFEPPIDPALLVRAVSMGLSIDSILNEPSPINGPHYRFQVMLQKALELASEVKSLGAQLLSAFEKRDAEELALLRSTHEKKLLLMIHDVKQKQVEESSNQKDSLSLQLENIEQRIQHYAQLLGPNGGEYHLNAQEQLQLNKYEDQKDRIEQVKVLELLSSVFAYIPEFKMGSATTLGTTYGGSNLVNGMKASAAFQASEGQLLSIDASRGGLQGGYMRRVQDWELQLATASKEKEQVIKQHTAAEIRHQIAQKELENHELQMSNSDDIDHFLRDKFSNQQLYHRMKNQLSTLYMQSYRMAYDIAKKAEVSFKKELSGNDSQSFINYANWGNLNEALLAGEKLTFDLRRMDVAYMEANKRSFELIKHVSFAVYYPLELLTLRVSGKCKIKLDQKLFTWDYPNHYNRRIKSVSISIPCIAGPYTTVGATLSHGNESIATSSGQNDSGVFELNFRDERYLPFEGVELDDESVWMLEMSQIAAENRQFDYDSISDVILHVRYLADKPDQTLPSDTSVREVAAPAFGRLFSLRHEFPTLYKEWKNSNDRASFEIPIDRLPYHLQKTTDKLVAIGMQADSLPNTKKLDSASSSDKKKLIVTDLGSFDKEKDVYIIVQRE